MENPTAEDLRRWLERLPVPARLAVFVACLAAVCALGWYIGDTARIALGPVDTAVVHDGSEGHR